MEDLDLPLRRSYDRVHSRFFLQKFDNTVAAFVGGTFWELENEDPNAQYFTSDFNTPEEMVDYGLTVAQQVEAEGADLSYGDVDYLTLDENEKAMLTNLAEMKKNGTIKKIVVLINSANPHRQKAPQNRGIQGLQRI